MSEKKVWLITGTLSGFGKGRQGCGNSAKAGTFD